MHWYYAKNGQSAGPVEEDEFQKLVADGGITNDTLVWHSGMKEWTAYGKTIPAVPEIEGRYKLKEMSLGEILDQAVVLSRNHFKLLILITCCLSVPFTLIQSFVNHHILVSYGAYGGGAMMPTAMTNALPTLLPVNIVFMLVLFLVVYPLTSGATIAAISGEYLGRSFTVGEALRFAVGKWARLLLTGILAGVYTTIGLFLFVIPGIYLAFKYWIASYVVVVEGLNGSSALKRSGVLMKGNMWKAFLLGLVLAVLGGLVGLLDRIIPVPALSIVIQTALQAVIAIFSSAACVVFYFSCRCVHERFNLAAIAETMERK